MHACRIILFIELFCYAVVDELDILPDILPKTSMGDFSLIFHEQCYFLYVYLFNLGHQAHENIAVLFTQEAHDLNNTQSTNMTK